MNNEENNIIFSQRSFKNLSAKLEEKKEGDNII